MHTTDKKITIELNPQIPTEERRLGWSPCGTQFFFEGEEGDQQGNFQIGEFPIIHVRFRKCLDSDEASLELDTSGTGTFEESDHITTTAKQVRGKQWYTFKYPMELPQSDGVPRPYPIALWHVEDPDRDDPDFMQWSRKGWHQGEFVHCDGESCIKAQVVIADSDRNGIFDKEDVWKFGTSDESVRKFKGVRKMGEFAWLNGKTYRATHIDRDGRSITIEPYEPGITEEDDERRLDPYAEDRDKPKAKNPVSFEADLTASLARAKAEGKRVLVDFIAEWCGPCKIMEEFVFPSKAVCDAGKDVIFVKLYEHEHPALTKEYEVLGYPTLILLDGDGQIVRREVEYLSVAKMAEFLG